MQLIRTIFVCCLSTLVLIGVSSFVVTQPRATAALLAAATVIAIAWHAVDRALSSLIAKARERHRRPNLYDYEQERLFAA